MLGRHAEQREHGLGLFQEMCAMIDGRVLRELEPQHIIRHSRKTCASCRQNRPRLAAVLETRRLSAGPFLEIGGRDPRQNVLAIVNHAFGGFAGSGAGMMVEASGTDR